jgi:hypothetical protein
MKRSGAWKAPKNQAVPHKVDSGKESRPLELVCLTFLPRSAASTTRRIRGAGFGFSGWGALAAGCGNKRFAVSEFLLSDIFSDGVSKVGVSFSAKKVFQLKVLWRFFFRKYFYRRQCAQQFSAPAHALPLARALTRVTSLYLFGSASVRAGYRVCSDMFQGRLPFLTNGYAPKEVSHRGIHIHGKIMAVQHQRPRDLQHLVLFFRL